MTSRFLTRFYIIANVFSLLLLSIKSYKSNLINQHPPSFTYLTFPHFWHLNTKSFQLSTQNAIHQQQHVNIIIIKHINHTNTPLLNYLKVCVGYLQNVHCVRFSCGGCGTRASLMFGKDSFTWYGCCGGYMGRIGGLGL